MKLVLKFILLLIHFGIVSLLTYYLGEQISKPMDISLVLSVLIAYVIIIMGVIAHVKNFILSFKNQTKL